MTLTGMVKRFLFNILLHFIIAMICGLLINAGLRFDTQAAFATGLSLGAAVSAAKVLLIERGISRSLSMKSAAAGMLAVLQITFRNVLTAGVLACAVLTDSISVWGVTAGLMLLQSAAFALKRKGA